MLRDALRRRRALREDVLERFGPACTSPATAQARQDGYFWLLGRVDDVINVAGHRIVTTEIESALVGPPRVAEAAVVGATDELKGQAIVEFVTLEGSSAEGDEPCARSCASTSHKEIGKIARPEDDALHRRSAEDALGQDHAPPAQATSPRDATSATRRRCAIPRSCSRSRSRPTGSSGARPGPPEAGRQARRKPLGAVRSSSGLVGSPSAISDALYARGATSFGPSGWKSAASSWMWSRPTPSSH